MNRNRILRAVPNFLAVALLSCIILGAMTPFCDVALSAESPIVNGLEFYYTNEKGDRIPLTMATASEAEGIALDSKGFLYVTDPAMNAVSVFNSNARLVRRISHVVRVPVAVSVGEDSESTTIYVGGYAPGYSNGFRVFKLGLDGSVNGSLGGELLSGLFNDMSAGKNGDVYVSVRGDSTVKMINKEGEIVRTFGRFSERKDVEVVSGVTRYRTMHTMASLSGVTMDEAKGELYVSTQEIVSFLNKTCSSGTCYTDADAYKYYANTGPEYMYWEPLVDRYCVVVIDLANGSIKRVIDISGGFASSGSTSSSSSLPKGLALDNKGRLYVATTSGILVYDSVTGIATAVSGSFVPGMYSDLVYVQDPAGQGGRLYATAGNRVYSYSIDSGAKPVNTAPTSAGLLSPSNGAYADAKTPDLKIANATDMEADPLLYGYEIRDSNGTAITSPNLTVGGLNGETLMAVNSILSENTVYRWRAQSFDGDLATWSAGDWESDKNNWYEFCVNERNDNPEVPVLTNPVNGASVSPFSSYLAWSPSKDPDCYDTVSYVLEISGDPYFGSILSSRAVVGESVKIGDTISGLANGSTYYWRVKSVDNNGGEATSNAGSFNYRTTVVKFESGQSGAKVFIDGNYGYSGRLLGAASLTLTVEGINPGSHFVTFVKAGYEPVYKIINVADPLDNESLLTVTAGAEEWLKASRVKPAVAATELFRTSGNSAPFIVDYNNDGLKDVIAGDADGNVYLYLSEVQMEGDLKKVVMAPQGAIQNINVGSNSAPFVVDYNNDGKKDLLVGAGDGLIYLHINGGTDHLPAFTSAETIKDNSGFDVRMSNSAPAIVDYNSDGKKDLVLGGAEGTLSLYLNIGTDAAPEFGVPVLIKTDNSELNLGPNINSKVFFTDWNNDGKKDMVVGGSALNLFLNVGTDAAPDFKSIAELQDWIKDKKRERGNREFIPYFGYNRDLADVVGTSTDVAPFVVDWGGTAGREVIVGTGEGSVSVYINEE